MPEIADLDDQSIFVTWDTRKPRRDDWDDYGLGEGEKHWCLMGEIREAWRSDVGACHRLLLCDKTGEEDTVDIRLGVVGGKKKSIRSFVKSHTAVVLYPEKKPESYESKWQDPSMVKATEIETFPFTLRDILTACSKAKLHSVPDEDSDEEGEDSDEDDEASDEEDEAGTKKNACQVCKKDDVALKPCGRCKLIWWCQKGDCRKLAYQEHGHGKDCKILKKMNKFLLRDWGNFEWFWSGPADADG